MQAGNPCQANNVSFLQMCTQILWCSLRVNLKKINGNSWRNLRGVAWWFLGKHCIDTWKLPWTCHQTNVPTSHPCNSFWHLVSAFFVSSYFHRWKYFQQTHIDSSYFYITERDVNECWANFRKEKSFRKSPHVQHLHQILYKHKRMSAFSINSASFSVVQRFWHGFNYPFRPPTR